MALSSSPKPVFIGLSIHITHHFTGVALQRVMYIGEQMLCSFTLLTEHDALTYRELKWFVYRALLFVLCTQVALTYNMTTNQFGACSESPQWGGQLVAKKPCLKKTLRLTLAYFYQF